jgi:hypothetical protein
VLAELTRRRASGEAIDAFATANLELGHIGRERGRLARLVRGRAGAAAGDK